MQYIIGIRIHENYIVQQITGIHYIPYATQKNGNRKVFLWLIIYHHQQTKNVFTESTRSQGYDLKITRLYLYFGP